MPKRASTRIFRFKRSFLNFRWLIVDMNVHVRLTVDLRTVPEKAHVNGIGEFGPFSRVSYSLGLSFGAGGIELRLLSDGKVVGSVECEYI